MTKSNSDPDADADAAGAGDTAAGGGDDEPNRLMMSELLVERDAAPVIAVVAAGSSLLDPKMSASRSCVETPDVAAPLGAVGVDPSSPIRSTTVSLSVRVDPTGFLSLTINSNPFSVVSRLHSLLTCTHDSRSDFRWRHSLQYTSFDIVPGEQTAEFDCTLLDLQLEIRTESSQHDGDTILLGGLARS